MKPQEFARKTIENYIKKVEKTEIPQKLIGVEIDQAGAFVSIKTQNGNLRGCIGTIMPTRTTVVDEVMNNAIASATRDPRFPAVEEHELEGLKYSVDILHAPERVRDFKELDPKVYGIIVTSETGKQALLLPDLEGLDTTEKQVAACMRKAGIAMDESISVQRFKVDRFSE